MSIQYENQINVCEVYRNQVENELNVSNQSKQYIYLRKKD